MKLHKVLADITLRRRTFWATLPLTVIPLVLFALLSYTTLRGALVEQAEARLEDVIRHASTEVTITQRLAEQSLRGELAALRYLIQSVGTPTVVDGKLALQDTEGVAVPVIDNNALVDAIADISGSQASIFQRLGDTAVRVATNVTDNTGKRVTGTTVSRPVYETVIERGETYLGTADVVGTLYLTAYEPLRNTAGEPIGMLFVGVAEDSLYRTLLRQIASIDIGEQGQLYVLDDGLSPVLARPGASTMPELSAAQTERLREARGEAADAGMIRLEDSLDGQQRHLYIQPIPVLGWTLVAEAYPRDYLRPLAAVRIYLFLALGLLIALMVPAAMLVGRIVSHNTGILVGVTGYLKAGDLEGASRQISQLADARKTEDEIALIAGAFRDALESLRLRDRELRVSEHRLQSLLAMASDGIHVLDGGGNVVLCSQSFADQLGYTMAEAQGLNMRDWEATIHQDRLIPTIKELIDTPRRFETRHKRKDGSCYDAEINAKGIDLDGSLLLYASARDISERKQNEARQLEEHRRLEAVVAGTDAGTWQWNVQTGETRFNERWAAIIGYTLEELAPISIATWTDHVHPDDLRESEDRLAAHFRGDTPSYEVTCRMRHRDGRWIWVHDSGRLLTRTGEGEPEWMYGTHLDITAIKEQELAVRRAGEKIEAIAASTNAGVLAIDQGAHIDYISPRFTSLFGYDRGDLVDSGAWAQRAGADTQSRQTLASVLERKLPDGHSAEVLRNHEIRIRCSSGRVRTVLLSVAGTDRDSVFTFSDISEQKSHEEQAEYLAQHDALTGLPNRVLLSERIGWHISQSKRNGALLCVAFLDLDGFKAINDSAGHDAGDRVLKAIAERLRESMRDVDTVARLGGDEFAIAFTDLKSREECVPMVRRILQKVRTPIEHEDGQLQVTCSIGLTFYAEGGNIDGDQLLRQADKAMYDAKVSGKDRFAVFDAMEDEHLRRRHRDLDDIVHALAAGEFELHYQPKVSLSSGAVTGVEALLRWRRGGELIPPDRFLPVIYDNELSRDLGAWVLERALGDLSRLIDKGTTLAVGINIFPRQIVDAAFATSLRYLLDQHPAISPGLIELEIVETAVLSDLDAARRTMLACRDMGVRFALDDFGTGFSSLTHLKHLPVTTLKLDKSFIADMLTDPDDLAIVEATLSLARAFGQQVIAEGVETLDQGVRLLELGCEAAQGYAIARAMPCSELPGWLATWRMPEAWATHRSEPGRHRRVGPVDTAPI